jgi:hypothetical protein
MMPVYVAKVLIIFLTNESAFKSEKPRRNLINVVKLNFERLDAFGAMAMSTYWYFLVRGFVFSKFK